MSTGIQFNKPGFLSSMLRLDFAKINIVTLKRTRKIFSSMFQQITAI